MEINKVRLQTNPTVIQAGSIYKFRLKKNQKNKQHTGRKDGRPNSSLITGLPRLSTPPRESPIEIMMDASRHAVPGGIFTENFGFENL